MSGGRFAKLGEKIGHAVDASPRIEAALTHSSAGAESNYERLEFLGDRVLGLVLAEILYEMFPHESEGGLAKRHAALVQGKTLAEIARDIDLGGMMALSESERGIAGTDNENILADGLEALLGALYLDAGLESCRTAIAKLWGARVRTMSEAPQDPKTALQEWAQARGLPLPVYEVTGREGPDHAPLFEVRVIVKGQPPQSARGPSLRAAEKESARLLLEQVEGDKA